MPTINERFKLIRENLGLSQTEFGEKLGLEQGSVGDVERARSGISKAVKLLLQLQYRVNPVWLEKGVGEMYIPNPPNDDDIYIKKINELQRDKEMLIKMIDLLEKKPPTK